MDTNSVWFITGASKGLGLALVNKLLAQGYQVAATSRTAGTLKDRVREHRNFLALEMDLADETSVKAAVNHTVETFGRIDVVVNNAGYGQIGTLEELTDREARQNFEINVFGSLNVIRHTMPHLRKQGSGHIMNISSVGGYTGAFPGWGIYCATKFAVAGFTESLAEEIKSFGVHATVVYPGYFRTNFLDRGSLNLPAHEIPAYKEAREVQQHHEKEIDGNQPGDPDKAADALIRVAGDDNPPVHLFLGSDAYQMARQKMETIRTQLDAYEVVGTSTDFAGE